VINALFVSKNSEEPVAANGEVQELRNETPAPILRVSEELRNDLRSKH
jgi:hypothetical protein